VRRVKQDDLLLALFHLPYNLAAFERAGVQLAFGGHTHGGQIRIPGYGALFTDSELPGHESAGLIWRGSTAIHISRGLGTDPRTNFRFFCPPAATVVEVVQVNVPSLTISSAPT
jgi:predicted MPP superfamily phosphohydrolase